MLRMIKDVDCRMNFEDKLLLQPSVYPSYILPHIIKCIMRALTRLFSQLAISDASFSDHNLSLSLS